jgi:putative membrane protein
MTLSDRAFYIWNLAISAVAVLFLVWLIYLRQTAPVFAEELAILPAMNALFNGMSAASLLAGLYFIKKDRRDLHRMAMISAFTFSAVFLVSYIVYHFAHGDTKFTAEGPVRTLYFFVLITHIVLSVIVLPMIFAAFFFALKERVETHRKFVRFAYPMWLYVSVTGVLIFALLKMFN